MDDMKRETGSIQPASQDLPPLERKQDNTPMSEKRGAAPHGGPGRGMRPRVGKGRVTMYLLLTILLNILLAIFALFILGVSVDAVKELLAVGSVESWPRLILLVLIMISPLLLTIFGNRLLYCGFRGRGRFPRGIWLFAVVLVLLVQFLTVYIAYTAGSVPSLESFEVQSFTTAEY